MPPSNNDHRRRIERLEDALSSLNSSVASHGAQILSMSGKIDQVLVEVRNLVSGLLAHTKDDDEVERRVHDLEGEHQEQLDHAKAATEDRRNIKGAMWLAGCTMVADLGLHLLEHLHLFN